jgi:hypothetical protein
VSYALKKLKALTNYKKKRKKKEKGVVEPPPWPVWGWLNHPHDPWGSFDNPKRKNRGGRNYPQKP